MVRTIRRVLLSVGLLFLAAHSSLAQTPDLPLFVKPVSGSLAPVSPPQVTPPVPSGSWSIGKARVTDDSLEDRNASVLAGNAHASGASLEDRNGSLLVGNVYLDGPRNNLGWFATADLDLLGAHVHNQLTAMVATGPMLNQVSLPSARLDWTVGPRFEAGYRFGQGAGELLVSYRFFATSGSATTPAFDAAGNDGFLRSRLARHVIDLDYGSQEPSLQPWFDMKWRFGVRLANLYFDSQETSPLLDQHVTNYFFGAGPHAALELWCPAAGLFCKLDLAGVAGKVQQGFAENVPDVASGFTRQTQFMPTFMLNVQAGIAWTPRDNWRISGGYTYEHWWDATFAVGSRGDVMTHGVFFRSEWKF